MGSSEGVLLTSTWLSPSGGIGCSENWRESKPLRPTTVHCLVVFGRVSHDRDRQGQQGAIGLQQPACVK